MSSPFDNVRYQALLEGLEISVMKLSEVLFENDKFRIDPEFYGKEFNRIFNLLRHHRRFADLLKNGYRVIYEKTEVLPREVGVLENLPFFLQSTNIKTPFVRYNEMGCVSKADWARYPHGRIHPGEVLIEVKGLAEKVALVSGDVPQNTLVTGSCYKMTPKDKLDAPLLLAYLTSQYGQKLKNRLKSNLLVSFISKDDLFTLPVPNFGVAFKKELAVCVDQCFESDRNSEKIIRDAEQSLLSALGLDNWQPPEPLTYTCPIKDVEKAERFDALYFSPAKQHAVQVLRKGGAKLLSKCVDSIREMYTPSPNDTAHVRNFDLPCALQPVLDDEEPLTQASELGSQKKRMKNGDVVISRLRAYLKEIAVVRTSDTALAVGSSEFIVLRPKDGGLSPETLAVFLRLPPVQTYLSYCQDGCHHPRFAEEDLLTIPVPNCLYEVDAQIVNLCKQAFSSRQLAKVLLAKAQRAVEVAIEEGEAAGMALLNG